MTPEQRVEQIAALAPGEDGTSAALLDGLAAIVDSVGEGDAPTIRDLAASIHLARNLTLSARFRFNEAVAAASAAIDVSPADPDLVALAFLYRAVDRAQLGDHHQAYADAVAAAAVARDPSILERAQALQLRLGPFLFLP